MSTAVASDYTAPLIGGRAHFLLRRLHSLTGIVFGGFVLFHLIVNAGLSQSVAGHDIYQGSVTVIHYLPLLHVWEWLFIYLPILYHTFYGAWIIVTGQPNVGRYPYGKNWNYLLQRISAVILIAFIFFHIFALQYHLFGRTLSFDWREATPTIARHMQASWCLPWIVYPLGILAASFHTANGFWTSSVTWGLAVSARGQRRWAWACVGLFVVLMVLGLISVSAATRVPALVSAPGAQVGG